MTLPHSPSPTPARLHLQIRRAGIFLREGRTDLLMDFVIGLLTGTGTVEGAVAFGTGFK
jgi:hypothetical protein